MARNTPLSAIAHISGGPEVPRLRGTVRFLPRCGGTLVIADIYGLPDSETGFFAFHIHEGGDCCGAGFPNTGGHFNPDKEPHPRHAGDLPPLLGNNGRAYSQVLTDRFSVSDIIGRTVVIHGCPDDLTTQPAGNAGSKIACGAIRRA